MNKEILSEIALYYGEVKMPKGWEIDRENIIKNILLSDFLKKEFMFTKEWDKLNKYIIEYVKLNYNLSLINKNTLGTIYKPNEFLYPQQDIDPVDLKNSPDFTLLYGVKVKPKSCFIRIHYDDNRRKGRSWDIPIENNHFVMFPSSQWYSISPNLGNDINFIQTITYEYV
jgi:hypothetical protein